MHHNAMLALDLIAIKARPDPPWFNEPDNIKEVIMVILFLGISSLVATIVTVMGVPFAYYMKRDLVWRESDRSVEAWYR